MDCVLGFPSFKRVNGAGKDSSRRERVVIKHQTPVSLPKFREGNDNSMFNVEKFTAVFLILFTASQ
jgi:hypothetical protein